MQEKHLIGEWDLFLNERAQDSAYFIDKEEKPGKKHLCARARQTLPSNHTVGFPNIKSNNWSSGLTMVANCNSLVNHKHVDSCKKKTKDYTKSMDYNYLYLNMQSMAHASMV
jgi:hypothetical protein